MAASILQLLLALKFSVIYSWQLLLSEKSLVWRKNSSIYLQDFADLDFFYINFFSLSLTNACLSCQLRKAYAVLRAVNRFVGSKTPKHNAFDQFWKSKFHFEHFPRKKRFLSFDRSSNSLYLFKNHRQTFLWPGKRPSSHLKVAKMWFGPNIKGTDMQVI